MARRVGPVIPMKAPAMKTPALATVYLDDEAIGLMGDPKPTVSKILAAGGLKPQDGQILRLREATDREGKALFGSDVIDRTADPAQPIYLLSVKTPVLRKPGVAPPTRAVRQDIEWSKWLGPTEVEFRQDAPSKTSGDALTPTKSGAERNQPAPRDSNELDH